MNITKIIITTLFLLGLGSQAQAGDYKLFDIGQDGHEHYYRISCQDPYSQGTVVVKYEEKTKPIRDRVSDSPSAEGEGLPPKRSSALSSQLPAVAEICSTNANDETQCRRRWSVAAAAQAMCR